MTLVLVLPGGRMGFGGFGSLGFGVWEGVGDWVGCRCLGWGEAKWA